MLVLCYWVRAAWKACVLSFIDFSCLFAYARGRMLKQIAADFFLGPRMSSYAEDSSVRVPTFWCKGDSRSGDPTQTIFELRPMPKNAARSLEPPIRWDRVVRDGSSLRGKTWGALHSNCSFGCGSKLNRRGYAGFGPCFHLPRFHFGSGF